MAAILQHSAGSLIFMKQFFFHHKFSKANTFTLLIIIVVQSLQIDLHSTNPWLTLSVLRIFVHSVSCHFSCQKACSTNFFLVKKHAAQIFFLKSQHSLQDLSFDNLFSNMFFIIHILMDLNTIFP